MDINNKDHFERGMYIHVPFCKYICKYCDFCKKFTKNFDHSEYIDALISEFRHVYENDSKIDTIYIGGGTPSALNYDQLVRLLVFINDNIDTRNVTEFSFECNPDDIDDKLLTLLQDSGVNRLSIGVQSLNDNILKNVNRNHTVEDVERTITLAGKYFNNISIDLMFNLPGQSIEDIKDSFTFIKRHSDVITHISYYSLILENNTVLGINNFENFSDDEEDEIYKLIQEELKSLGYEQYEISNFCKNSFESKHNMKYWSGSEYYGIGLGASQYICKHRTTNTRSMKRYIENINMKNYEENIVDQEFIDKEEEIKEKIIFNLRTKKGIESDILSILLKEDDPVLEYLIENVSDKRISIRQEYYFISNQIIIEFLERYDDYLVYKQ